MGLQRVRLDFESKQQWPQVYKGQNTSNVCFSIWVVIIPSIFQIVYVSFLSYEGFANLLEYFSVHFYKNIL